MNATYKTEERIGREKARAILAAEGMEEEFIPGGDYYLCLDDENREFLHLQGRDEPECENTGTTSWASPGYPAE